MLPWHALISHEPHIRWPRPAACCREGHSGIANLCTMLAARGNFCWHQRHPFKWSSTGDSGRQGFDTQQRELAVACGPDCQEKWQNCLLRLRRCSSLAFSWHIYICIYIYTYIHLYIYTFMYKSETIHLYIYIYIYIYLWVYRYIYVYGVVRFTSAGPSIKLYPMPLDMLGHAEVIRSAYHQDPITCEHQPQQNVVKID